MKGLLLCINLFLTSAVFASEYQEQLDRINSLRLNDISQARNILNQLTVSLDKLSASEKNQYLILQIHSAAMHSEFEKALQYYQELKNTTREKISLARASSIISSVYMLKGDYQKSFIELYELLDNLDSFNDYGIKKTILLNALSKHIALGLMDKAQDFSRKMLALAKVANDDEAFCETNYHIVNIQKEFKDFEYAYRLNKEAKQNCEGTSKKFIGALFELQAAEIEYKTGNIADAFKNLESMEQDFLMQTWPAAIAEFNLLKAEISLEAKKLDVSKRSGIKAYQYAKEKNDTTLLKKASRVLAVLFKTTGDLDKAHFYNQEMIKATVELSEQLEKRRLGYYQAMNLREKQKSKSSKEVALEVKNSAPIPAQ